MSFDKNPRFVLDLSESDLKGGERNSYRFKSFRLDVTERQLLHDNAPVTLTPKAFDLLALLVERSGHLVEKDELLETVWPDSFVEEQNITRIIHTLRRLLGEGHNGDKFIETVARKGYRFVADVTVDREPDGSNANEETSFIGNARSAPNSPVFASGTDRATPAVASGNPSTRAAEPKQRTRIVLFTVGFLSAVSLLVLLSFDFQSKSEGTNRITSIAILPVRPVNAAQQDDVYEMGIAESLINALGPMKGLVVRPLSATRQYSDIAQDPLAAGREQKADYVLASHYQIADGRIRITAQLFNVATGQAEETFKSEKELGDIFAVQDAIAGEVGNKLLTRFSMTENIFAAKRGTTNEEAYRLYLQGRNLSMQRNKKAIEYFEQAIKLDPNYALAYARMANTHLWFAVLDSPYPRAGEINELIKKALELDPNVAEGYVARGQVNLAFEWNLPAAEKDFLRAIELEPNNDTAHWLYALLLANRGRFDEALKEIETAQTIDPSATVYMMHRGRILYFARRYDEAVLQFEQLMDLDENSFSNWTQWAYKMKGDEAKAYEIFIKIRRRNKSEHLEIYQKTFETEGLQAVRRKVLEVATLDHGEFPGGTFHIAKEYALLGEKDLAFEYLNKAVEKRSWLMSTLNVEPAFDNLRGDPRFDELLQRVRSK